MRPTGYYRYLFWAMLSPHESAELVETGQR